MNQVWSPPVQSSPSGKEDGWVKVDGEKYSRGNKCGDRNMCTVCVSVFLKNNLFRIRLCTELEFTRERVSVIMTICSCVPLPVQLGKLRATWMSEPLLHQACDLFKGIKAGPLRDPRLPYLEKRSGLPGEMRSRLAAQEVLVCGCGQVCL